MNDSAKDIIEHMIDMMRKIFEPFIFWASRADNFLFAAPLISGGALAERV